MFSSLIYDLPPSFSDESIVVMLLLLVLFGVGCLMLFLISIPKWLYHKKIRDSGIEEVDLMSGWEFEKFLEGLFKRLGYKVKLVGSNRGDYGGDLILEKNGTKILVQAKRYKNKVGIKAIQEVVAGRRKYNCHKTMLITNNYLTKPAWDLGVANDVTMWTRKKLIENIVLIKHSSESSKHPN